MPTAKFPISANRQIGTNLFPYGPDEEGVGDAPPRSELVGNDID
jgi:hypothetical protein